jgi:asparagine synthase (glutamine-hydrolysing)
MKLPDRWKIRGLNEKYILKKAFHDIIPASIINRAKQPYRAPIRQVFFSKENTYVDELLSFEQLSKTGYFNPQKVSLLVNKFRKADQFIASETQNMALVGILSTQVLHNSFIENFLQHTFLPIDVTKKIIRTK